MASQGMTTIRIPTTPRHEASDDVLAMVASEVADERDLQGWDLGARWEDDQRDAVLLDIPAEDVRDDDATV